MKKIQELLAKRTGLVQEGQALVNEGKYTEFEALAKQIEALDNEIEAAQLAEANLKALQDNSKFANFDNSSQQVAVVGGASNVLAAFNAPVQNEKIYENAFGKTLLGQELTPQENAVFMEMNNSHTTTTAGVAIPTTTLNEIITEISSQNPFFADARKLNIKGNVKLAKHKAITAGDAAGQTEGTDTTEEENTFVDIELTGKEVTKYLEVSFKLEAMSVPALLDYLKTEIVDRVGAELGRQAIAGNGTTEMTGVLTALADVAAQKTTYVVATGVTYEKVTEAFGKIGSKHAGKVAVYANSHTVWNVLANIKDETGRPYFIADTTAGGVGRLFGKVVKEESGLSNGTILIGDATGYAINTNEDINVESDRNIKSRKTGFSAYTIVDGDVTHEKAFSIIIPAV